VLPARTVNRLDIFRFTSHHCSTKEMRTECLNLIFRLILSFHLFGAKKNEGHLRLPRRRSVGTPLNGGLQILLGLSNFVQSDLFRPSVSGRGSSSRFYLSTLARLSQGTAYSYRVTLMVRPLLLAEPGPGDASFTIWTLSVFFRPLHFQAGQPSSRFAFRSNPVFRPLPSFLRPQPFGRWVSSNGGFKILPIVKIVKAKKVLFRLFF